MSTAIRIEMVRDGDIQTYYEPNITPTLEEIFAALRQYGWEITTERVDAEEEIEVLQELAAECRKHAARLMETTPAWLDFVIGAQYCEALIKAVTAAANGSGSLLLRS